GTGAIPFSTAICGLRPIRFDATMVKSAFMNSSMLGLFLIGSSSDGVGLAPVDIYSLSTFAVECKPSRCPSVIALALQHSARCPMPLLHLSDQFWKRQPQTFEVERVRLPNRAEYERAERGVSLRQFLTDPICVQSSVCHFSLLQMIAVLVPVSVQSRLRPRHTSGP